MMEPTNIPPVPSSPAWPIMLMPRKLTVSEWGGGGRDGVRCDGAALCGRVRVMGNCSEV